MCGCNNILTLETAIKLYNANKDDDLAVYSVFFLLATESVLVPVNSEGNMLSLTLQGMDVIPLFASKERIKEDEPVVLCPIFLPDYVEILLKAERNLIINPFSEPELQFLIPFEAIKKLLIPAIEHSPKDINNKEWRA